MGDKSNTQRQQPKGEHVNYRSIGIVVALMALPVGILQAQGLPVVDFAVLMCRSTERVHAVLGFVAGVLVTAIPWLMSRPQEKCDG